MIRRAPFGDQALVAFRRDEGREPIVGACRYADRSRRLEVLPIEPHEQKALGERDPGAVRRGCDGRVGERGAHGHACHYASVTHSHLRDGRARYYNQRIASNELGVPTRFRISSMMYARHTGLLESPRGRLLIMSLGFEDRVVRFLSGLPPETRVATIPQGAGLLFFSGLRSADPISTYLPTDMAGRFDDPGLVKRWKQRPPDVIFVWREELSGFGSRGFGEDYAQQASAFIQAHYVPMTDPAREVFLLHHSAWSPWRGRTRAGARPTDRAQLRRTGVCGGGAGGMDIEIECPYCGESVTIFVDPGRRRDAVLRGGLSGLLPPVARPCARGGAGRLRRRGLAAGRLKGFRM